MKEKNPQHGMLMFASVSFALIVSGFANKSQAQKIDKKHPSVYITFQEFVRETPDPAYPSQGVRLVLHNNTRWPIYFGKHYDPTAAGESVIYTIELADGTRDARRYVNVARNGKLMPGRTVSVLVPRGDFSKGSKIYVDFFFSWELVPPEENIGDQTVHRAYFRASDLSPWPQK